MKRIWRNCLAIVAVATMVGSANAQSDWNQPSAIGSYQSILSRAGYGNSMGSTGQAIMQPGIPMQGSALQSAAMQGGAMAQGSMSRNGMPQGGMIQGSGVQTAPMIQSPQQVGGMTSGSFATPMNSGQIITSGPITTGPAVMSVPMQSSPMMTGNVGSFDMGSTYSAPMAAPSIYSGVISGPVPQSACAAPVYAAPVYQQQASYATPALVTGQRARPKSNYTVGLYGMSFERDYEDNRFLARNPSGDTLFTNDADEGSFNGYAVNIAKRNAGGGGLEATYWALNPRRSVGVLSGVNVATNISGLGDLRHVSSNRDLLDIYSNTVVQTIVRETDINNLEFNMLRNGGTFHTKRSRRGFYELLAGFRWFEFNEGLQYTASIDNNAFPLVPANFFYNLEARNRLLGFQLGARNELSISSKLRVFSGVKGGIFNNNINTVQNLTDGNGEIAQVTSSGRPFSYRDEKNDVAFLGELNFGILYQLSCRARVRVGYRALGVSGVALAADQLPFDYSDADELSRANSNGSLLLHGGYYGLEFCF